MFESLPRRPFFSLLVGASVLVAFATAGCVVHHHHPGSGAHVVKAPPRSPAHGYVHRHHGVVLVFDGSWKGYWVRGHPHHYFYADHYYRWHNRHWQRAPRIGGPWVSVELSAVPAGLRHRTEAKERREERREAAQERREGRREAAEERRDAAKERHEVAQERREERREAAQERREERREEANERREERREAVQERREERREVANERREERREAAQERREERREVAESKQASRTTKRSGEPARGSSKDGRRTVAEGSDEEIPANQDVE